MMRIAVPALVSVAIGYVVNQWNFSSQSSVQAACSQIAGAVSNASDVYYPGDSQFNEGILHYAISSSEPSVCSVEPGTAEDVGVVLRILGETRTSFGVKGGGHMMNPGSASSQGVQITMSRFSAVKYNDDAQTVDIGPGLIWDEVYAALEPLGINVVGGRASGIGMAGFSLGGGYSWKTNQYGLTIDTIQAYELVLPNGTVWDITESSHPDLFFGLKGGYNNFGIVTKFTLRAHPQAKVWGGLVGVSSKHVVAVKAAAIRFSEEVTDPKASMLINLMYIHKMPMMLLGMFYDAPTPPAGIFDDFMAIPNFKNDTSTRTFLSLVQAHNTSSTVGHRGAYGSVPLQKITPAVFDAAWNSILSLAARAEALSIFMCSYALEPFMPDILTHGGPSAYPDSREQAFLPINVNVLYDDPAKDAEIRSLMDESTAFMSGVAFGEGSTEIMNAVHYPNYAKANTAPSLMYGKNLPRLIAMREQYDPEGVMLLAGGWKFV